MGIFDSSVTVTHQSQCFRLSRLVDNPDLGTIKSFPFQVCVFEQSLMFLGDETHIVS